METERTPLILTGPAGCGKSFWIQEYAKRVRKQLCVCPCRKDRTLREGRSTLHIWSRRTEPAILWLEGADDLTPEAQAFLRRMLETYAPEVQMVLECRDAGRLQEPIRSRCVMKRMGPPSWDALEDYLSSTYPFVQQTIYQEIKEVVPKEEWSYRRIQQCVALYMESEEEWKDVVEHHRKEKEVELSSDKMVTYLQEGYHPEHLLRRLFPDEEILRDYGRCMEWSGSLWDFLGSALDKRSTSPRKEEE